jgi:hypothetical protein
MKKIWMYTLPILFTTILTITTHAQPNGGGGGQGQGGQPPGNGAAPIDGGAILLVVGAAAYGRAALRNRTKEALGSK